MPIFNSSLQPSCLLYPSAVKLYKRKKRNNVGLRDESRPSQSEVCQGERTTVKVKCLCSVNVSVQWWLYSNSKSRKLANGSLLAQLPGLIEDIQV